MIIVSDANEVFAALISRTKTLELFFNKNLEIISPVFVLNEVDKYLDEIKNKSGLDEDDFLYFLTLISSKIKFYPFEEYKEFFEKAKKVSPDANDVDYFALALKFNCPIWSEDKELKKQVEVKIFSTQELVEDFKIS